MRIVGAGFVSDPLIVAGVDVRDIGMTWRVHRHEVVDREGARCRNRGRRARLHGNRTAGGDVPTAHRRWLLILRKSSQADYS
jgi:hypothetical protein